MKCYHLNHSLSFFPERIDACCSGFRGPIYLENPSKSQVFDANIMQEIKKVYSKDIYAYAPIISLTAKLNEISDYSSYKTEDLVKMISEILILLKTNERGTADLSTINLAKNYGTFYLNKKLSSGMKLMAESITGYFEQEIFEVPRGI